MSTPTEPVLRARGVRKSFGGIEVLHGVEAAAATDLLDRFFTARRA